MKKILSITVLLIMCLCTVCGCAPKPDPSEISAGFYGLKEAYDYGLLTREDLKNIAELHNNGAQSSETLDPELENELKEMAAEELRNREIDPIADAVSSWFRIGYYYGKYSNDCYALILSWRDPNGPMEPAVVYPTKPTRKSIGGIIFINPGTIKIWKQK